MAVPGRAGGASAYMSESGIPTGLNRIKTPRERVDSWAQESDSPSSGFSTLEFHVRQKLKALNQGYGRLGRSKEGFRKGRKIAQWFNSSLLKDPHRGLDDSLSVKNTPSELDMRDKEDHRSKLCRMDNISSVDAQEIRTINEVPKTLKSFSHELHLKVGNQFGHPRTRSYNDMKELLGSLHSRFDSAKEVVNIELGSFSRDLLEILQNDGSFTPDDYRMAEELYVLTRQCIDMSSSEFRKKCEIVVCDLNVKRQTCQMEMLKFFFTRILFILTRCTRLLHFEDSEPSNVRSLDKFRECLERIPSVDMSWFVDNGFLESDMGSDLKETKYAMEKLQGEQLISPYLDMRKNSVIFSDKQEEDPFSVYVQTPSAYLTTGVKTAKRDEMFGVKISKTEKDNTLDDSNLVICRICEDPVPAAHLEPHSYICAFADKCFSKHLDVNERLMIAAELLEHIKELHNSNNHETYENLEISRIGTFSPALNPEVYSPKCNDWRGKGMDGMLEDLHEMDTACIEDCRLANLVNLKNHWLTKVNQHGSPSSNGSMTSSSTCSPQTGFFDNFLSDLYLLEQEDVQQISVLADIARCVAATDLSDEGSPEFLLACMHDLRVVLHNSKCKALLVDTFGGQIEGLLREKYVLACSRTEDIGDPESTKILMDTASQSSTTSTPSHNAHKDRTTIDDFDIIKPVSRGAFGKVFLARKRTTGDLFAIKVLRKLDMLRKNDIDRILAERNILITARNPFVVRFFYSFTSKESLYLVMEYLNGGDLYSLLKNVGCLDEAVARSYIAELVLALQYLHSLGIVHRDLKPDNILIAQDGHIKLTDFGLSKIGLMNCTSELSNQEKEAGFLDAPGQLDANVVESHLSAVGTPDYLAPEILLGTEHGYAADWWSVGIILFEFLTGIPPFNADNPENIFDNILNRKIPWPSVPSEMSSEAQDLIDRLLIHDPNLRLGAKGAAEVKAHPFFSGVDWDNLALQKASFIPQPERLDDTSYFVSRYNLSGPEVDESSMDSDSDDSNSEAEHQNMDEYGDLAEFGVSPVDLSLINFSFKNLSQLASINQVVLLKSGKKALKSSSPNKISDPDGS